MGFHGVGESHSRPNSAGLFGVDVFVGRLMSGFPVELSAQSEDPMVGSALRRYDSVPLVIFIYSASAGHVALTG
uniref:Uncharacterized protein n=1 Tax=Cannabis sativa TaxID=3483 RepID=A0A803R0C7_CANSA